MVSDGILRAVTELGWKQRRRGDCTMSEPAFVEGETLGSDRNDLQPCFVYRILFSYLSVKVRQHKRNGLGRS